MGTEVEEGKKGVKLARMDLVPPEALWAWAEVLGFGSLKYAERNWENGYEFGKAIGAALRHITLFQAGEDIDPESGKHHLAHAMTCLGFVITFQARGVGTDDRPTGCGSLSSELLNPEDIIGNVSSRASYAPVGAG